MDAGYRVRRSTRARRVTVRVDPRNGGVEVVLPARAPARLASEAMVELAPWIERRVAEAVAVQDLVAARAGTVPYLGSTLRLVPEPGRERVARRRDVLLVPAGDAAPALERWLRRQARAEVVPRLDVAAGVLGVRVNRVAIRDTRTRWGSCSSAGTLSFSWRLVLAPEEVLEYVVWHEACHLRVMDHSPRFWSLLAEHVPDHETPRRWLRDHGASLTI